MHAFDFILVLFSFVYAAAVTHVLSTAGEIIIAARAALSPSGRFLEMRAHVLPHLVMPVGPFVSALRAPVV
jgi:hypothetical protein